MLSIPNTTNHLANKVGGEIRIHIYSYIYIRVYVNICVLYVLLHKAVIALSRTFSVTREKKRLNKKHYCCVIYFTLYAYLYYFLIDVSNFRLMLYVRHILLVELHNTCT